MPTMAPFHSTTTASNMPNHHDHQAAEVRVARRAPLNLGDEARGRREGRLGRGHSCTALNIPSFTISCYAFLFELQGPDWAVGCYTISPPADGIPQKAFNKI